MKILYLSSGGNTQDYMRDCVAHGMRTLLGPDFVDVNKLDSLYIGADRTKMYGLGFSLYSLLPDIEVDRTDIPAKIRNKFFDLIIWGSIHRNQDYLHEAESMYDSSKLLAIDGEDHPGFLNGLTFLTLKRELHNPQPRCLPIQFAIPAEKILKSPPSKNRLVAPMDPLRKSTYIYTTEASYYAQYAESYYGITMRKAGADCLRHVEILSQWCIPYFRCLETIPPLICQYLPRRELRLAQLAIEYYHGKVTEMDIHPLIGLYHDMIEPCMKALRDHMTTEALATYVLSTVGVKESVCA